jgi:Tfp pilus assembly protein PilE
MIRRGITLIELLVSLAISVFVGVAVVGAFHTAVQMGPSISASNDKLQAGIALEDRLRKILSHAWINTSRTDQSTYFTSDPQVPVAVATGSTGSATTSSSQTQSGSGNGGAPGGGAPELVFTAMGLPPQNTALYNDDDFETSNSSRGPAGGTTEYGLSLQPVGNAQGLKGVFLREQHPADTDPTQGGEETLLIPDVDTLSFEFWDGTEWQTTWDTPNMTPKRIPAAVRVTYSIGNGTPHTFIVTLPNSDVTAANPVSTTGTTGTATTTTGGGA